MHASVALYREVRRDALIVVGVIALGIAALFGYYAIDCIQRDAQYERAMASKSQQPVQFDITKLSARCQALYVRYRGDLEQINDADCFGAIVFHDPKK